MQLTLYLRAMTPVSRIPWGYPEAVTAWIYGILQGTAADPVPHRTASQTIRPFATTPILFPDAFTPTAQGIRPSTPWATLLVKAADASLLEVVAERAGNHPLRLGPTQYTVESTFPSEPEFSTPWTTQLLGPVVVATRPVSGSSAFSPKIFIGPDHPRFMHLLRQNLAKKAWQFSGDRVTVDDVQIVLPRRWKRKLWMLYGHPIIGWTSQGSLTIAGPPSIIIAAATFGLGVSNTHGFGALDTVDEGGENHAKNGRDAFWI